MGVLEVLGHDGDIKLEWDPWDPVSTEQARGEFQRLKAQGYLLFTVRQAVETFVADAGVLAVELAAVAGAPSRALSPAPAGVVKRPKRAKRSGVTAEETTQTREFDPDASRIVAAPPMRGG